MKILLVTTLLSLLLLAGSSGPTAPEPERVDTNHSSCGFSVPILGGLSQVTGKFSKYSVDLEFDPAEPESATVSVTIDAASVDTGIDDRDQHLQAPDFFDVAKHPEITFVSKQVTELEGDQLEVLGDLTLRGKTQQVVLAVDLLYPEDFDSKVVGFVASTEIDRTDYGVSYQHRDIPDFIGHDVSITIHTYARLR